MSQFAYLNDWAGDNFISLFEIAFSPKYYRIIEQDLYQPVFHKRALKNEILETEILNKSFFLENSEQSNSSTASNNNIKDRNSYYAFFVMAQIGGFFSFLKLVFSIISSLFIDKIIIIEIMNSLRHGKRNNMIRKSLKRSKIRRVNPTQTIKQNSKLSIPNEERKLTQNRNNENFSKFNSTFKGVSSKSIQREEFLNYIRSKKSKFRSLKDSFEYNYKDIIYMTLC